MLRNRQEPFQRALRDTAVLASGTIVSRVLGFARDLLFACLLGPGADAFLAAFRVPNFFRRLLSEGSLGTAYSAEISGCLAARGEKSANSFARLVIVRLFLLSLPLVLLLALAAKPLMLCLAPGLGGKELADAVLYLRLFLPYLPLCLVSSLAFAHAASFGNFRPQAWGPVLWNIGIVLAGLVLPPAFFMGGSSAAPLAKLLCLGVVLGGMAQAALALRCLAVYGVFPLPPALEKHQEPAPVPASPKGFQEAEKPEGEGFPLAGAWFFLRRFPAAVAGAAPHQLHVLAGTVMASFLTAGGISALYFAERLVELPVGLAGAAVGFAVLPTLAAQARQGSRELFSATLGESLRRSAFVSFPAAGGLFALAWPLADALFGHGAFAGPAVTATAEALRWYSFAVPALCAARPLVSASHALGKGGTPLKTAAVSLLPLVLCSLGGMAFWGRDASSGSVAGVSIGLAAGAWLNAFLLLRHVKSCSVPCPLAPHRRVLGQYFAGTLALAALLHAYGFAAGPPGPLECLGMVGAGVVIWVAFFYAVGSPDAHELADAAGKWKKNQP